MIEIKTKPNKDISCHLEGDPAQLFVEYNSATVGMIIKLRKKGDDDKDIRDLLLGNVDIAFSIANAKNAIKEVPDGKDKDKIIHHHPGI